MVDTKNDSAAPWIGESIVRLYNRLRKYGPTTTPEAEAIAATNRLVEHLLAAIEVWEAARSRTNPGERSGHAHLGAELDALRGTLTELSDGIAEMGGAATDERDRELRNAVVDIDWASDENSLQAVLSRIRAHLVGACSATGSCKGLPSETRSAVERLAVALRATPPL